MYETIQVLPLFQGTSADQISDFLAKTKVEFAKFRPGDRIAEVGDECSALKFIISGSVRCYMGIAGGKVALCTYLGPGSALCAANLFGMYTHFQDDVTCVTEGSYMSITKGQYFKLLQSAPIYLLNYINYLSFHAQRARRSLCMDYGAGLRVWIEGLREGLIDRHTQGVELHSTLENLASIASQSVEQTRRTLDEMASSGELSYEGDIVIHLFS
ncbi:MAG: cyclic nucleotide-binding domain-containing protein [Muribaculaceae bacterium]|nr:cyclic nucleotide-binding domain-containing protein [Muribaculaceae bacterium]